MKDSKFWIWFIPLFIIIGIGAYFMLTKANNNYSNNQEPDSIRIKNEYSNNNDKYYNVNLSDTNVYKYINDKDIKDFIDNKDGLILIGNSNDNISRKSIVVLNDYISSTSIPEVYYIDINDLSDNTKNYISEKLDLADIKPGTIIAIKQDETNRFTYPLYLKDSNELSDKEKENLINDYKKVTYYFNDSCDENC